MSPEQGALPHSQWFIDFDFVYVLKGFEYRRPGRLDAVQRVAKLERAHVVPAGRHRRVLEVHGEVTAGREAVRCATHVPHTAQGGQGEIPDKIEFCK